MSIETLKPCILCEKNSGRPFFQKGGHTLLKCASCGLVYLDLEPGGEELRALYGESYFRSDSPGCGYADYFANENLLKLNFRRRARELDTLLPGGGSLLEIGCGPGFFLETLSSRWTAHGVEISEYAAAAAAARGLNVRAGVFSTDDFAPGEFDAVATWDVLEHLDNPVDMLHGINTVLKPGGLLILSTGDVSSTAARLSGARWHLYTIPEHLYFYSPATLKLLLEKTGFGILNHRHETCWYSMDYLLERIIKSLGMGNARRIPGKKLLSRIPLPVNLFDISTIAAKKIR